MAPTKSDDPATQGLAFIQDPGQEAIDAFNAYTCPSTKPVVDDPTKYLVTCGTEDDAATKYLLSPAVIEGTDLDQADAQVPPNQVAWIVQLGLGGDGKGVFGDLSQAMSGSEQQFAIVLDGQVISAPTFNSPILDGNAADQRQLHAGLGEVARDQPQVRCPPDLLREGRHPGRGDRPLARR